MTEFSRDLKQYNPQQLLTLRKNLGGATILLNRFSEVGNFEVVRPDSQEVKKDPSKQVLLMYSPELSLLRPAGEYSLELIDGKLVVTDRSTRTWASRELDLRRVRQIDRNNFIGQIEVLRSGWLKMNYDPRTLTPFATDLTYEGALLRADSDLDPELYSDEICIQVPREFAGERLTVRVIDQLIPGRRTVDALVTTAQGLSVPRRVERVLSLSRWITPIDDVIEDLDL